MQTSIFLVLGYGVPEDLNSDLNYRAYLNLAFNHVFARCAGTTAVIIPCGGLTNGEPPYDVTETQVLGQYLESLVKKFDWFREQAKQGVPPTDIVEEWYRTRLYELTKEQMPDHPLLLKPLHSPNF